MHSPDRAQSARTKTSPWLALATAVIAVGCAPPPDEDAATAPASATRGAPVRQAVSDEPTSMIVQAVTASTASDIELGRQLFVNETFGGNGRTCATCHVLTLDLGLPPSNIAARFATFKTTFDPLFIAEPEMNLNTLTVTVNPSSPVTFAAGAILTGTDGSGHTVKAKVLTSTVPNKYLVFGGILPPFKKGTSVSDGKKSLPVFSIIKGDLDGLENPARMRGKSKSPDFPQGRGLILENIDGFNTNPPVFRKSPELRNLRLTAPFGFSSSIFTLEEFSVQAVKQHFPRTLARRIAGDPGVTEADFRLPTPEEQRLLKVFMESLDSITPAGDDFTTFRLDHFARTATQRQGRQIFQTKGQCNACHNSSVLSGFSLQFNTGVANQPINGPPPAGDSLPSEPPFQPFGSSSRLFDVPPLFNAKNNAPFFHDASVATLDKAVRFYISPTFKASPEGRNFNIDLNDAEVTNVVQFLTGLVQRPYVVKLGSTDVTRADTKVDFGSVAVNAAPVSKTLTITNTNPSGGASIKFPALPNPACKITGLIDQNPVDFPAPDCGQLNNLNLEPGKSKTITVKFDPATPGLKSAILEILAPDPTGVDLVGAAPVPGCTPVTFFHLVNTPVAINPPGELMQPNKTNANGFFPTHLLDNPDGFTWYTAPMTGILNAGDHKLEVWTNFPGGDSSFVAAQIGVANADGSNATVLTASVLDVNTTGTGNHISPFIMANLAQRFLNNQRLFIRLLLVSGTPATVVYNGGSDFDTNLKTAGGCTK